MVKLIKFLERFSGTTQPGSDILPYQPFEKLQQSSGIFPGRPDVNFLPPAPTAEESKVKIRLIVDAEIPKSWLLRNGNSATFGSILLKLLHGPLHFGSGPFNKSMKVHNLKVYRTSSGRVEIAVRGD